MAWRCSGNSNRELVAKLAKSGIITNASVRHAMEKTDRALYCIEEFKRQSYDDSPLPIGPTVTISAPHMHAYCLDLLADYLKPGNRALDIGSGSGYLVACMAEMMVPDHNNIVNNTKIVGLEYLHDIYKFGKRNIQHSERTRDLLENGVIEMVEGDGWKGHASLGPYHAIHVGAAAETVPKALVDQLALGGRLVIPVGDFMQSLMCVDKDMHGKVTQRHILDVRYVPLIKPGSDTE